MLEMLTAKDMQDLLQVDRSTIYRMAESGRLPAFKVGKQWRFRRDEVQVWLSQNAEQRETQSPAGQGVPAASRPQPDSALAQLLPLNCVQLIQDNFADLLGTMAVITDMNGQPVTTPSNACGFFEVVQETPNALQKCLNTWQGMANDLSLEPKFKASPLGLLCARAYIRNGSSLIGMVVLGCIAPDVWPPTTAELTNMAKHFGVDPQSLQNNVNGVHHLASNRKDEVLTYVQRLANIVTHIINEHETMQFDTHKGVVS